MPAGKSGGKFKVALANREITNDVNRDIIAGATAEIEAAGGEIAQVTDAGTDPLKHNDNIATLINSDVDAILVQLGDAQQLSPLAQQATEKGILVATTLVGATPEGALTDVGFDDPLAAALETRALFSSIGYQGDVYLFWVPGAPILETRRAIAETMAQDYPLITIHEVPTEHGAVKTLAQMTDILTANPEPGSIAGVWGAYDLLVSGAVEAVRRAGRGDDIKAVSIDGDKVAFQMLFQEGSPFVSTVVADMKGIGKVAADAIILASCGRADEVPIHGYTPMWVANRHNGLAAGEMRWGENLWTDLQMDRAQIEAANPQTQDVMVVQPQLP
jgi:ABC-type sugar transport system substrate-binding protein